MDDVARLRRQNKEAADRRQRECAPIHARHDWLVNLMREAMERHNQEMGKEGAGLHISQYGQATAAAIIGERNEARQRAERAEKVLRKLVELDAHLTFGVPPPGWRQLIEEAFAVLEAI